MIPLPAAFQVWMMLMGIGHAIVHDEPRHAKPAAVVCEQRDLPVQFVDGTVGHMRLVICPAAAPKGVPDVR